MRLIAAVYDALRTFDRPCTRTELEDASGLSRHEVRNGIDGLRHRRLLLVVGSARERATYRLKPGAQRPEELRGRQERPAAVRHRIAVGVARHRAAAPQVVLLAPDPAFVPHRAAAPAGHAHVAGAARRAVPSSPPALSTASLLQQILRRGR